MRELAQRLGLARRTGRKLTLTAKGRRLVGDPEQLWRAVAAFLLVGDSDFMASSNLCRSLGLLKVGADWRDRSCGLTETGKATALEALRARATGPRTIPWL